MNYNVTIKRSAEKELERLPDKIHERILTRLFELKDNPRPFSSEKMKGEESYRTRVGDFRIVYSINDKAKIVEILKSAIGKRFTRSDSDSIALFDEPQGVRSPMSEVRGEN